MTTKVKTAAEIDRIKTSGKMLATVLKAVTSFTKPGVSLLEVNDLAKKELISLGGKPAFYGYQGFPGVICTSLNDEVVHGIPTDRQVSEGDLVSYDFGVNYEGMITDSAVTIIAGTPKNTEAVRLLEATKESMFAGFKTLKNGTKTGTIGAAIEQVLLRNKLGIVRDLVGHGVGHELHEEPNIPNYGKKGTGFRLETGMTIAIEPMAMLGDEKVIVKEDGWTVATADGSLSAHFEHTVLVTDDGYEIITTA